MKAIITVMASDALNRYNYKFALSALEQMVYEHCIEGVPSYYNHDIHQPIGWGHPYALLFEPNMIKVLGIIHVPETVEDEQKILSNHKIAQKERFSDPCAPYLDAFKPLLEQYNHQDLKFHFEGGVNCISPNLTRIMFPVLFEENDKDGLIAVETILLHFDYIGKGIFKHKKDPFAIFAHQFFRRSMSRLNNFHWSFLDEFITRDKTASIKAKIKVDIDMVGYSPSLRPIEELDYWYGPGFSDDISKIKIGTTHHESNADQRIKSGLVRTEFNWKEDENEKTFESEELVNNATAGIGKAMYGCRYTHSIYDLNTNFFIHFDGAIRIYDEEMILVRMEKKFIESGHNTIYEKLFRMDGQVPVGIWKSLLNKFYQGNPLVQEYLEVKDPYKFLEALSSEETIIDRVYKLIPYSIQKGDGVKICIAYQKEREVSDSVRTIVAFDELIFKNKRIRSIEFDIIELKKFLNKKGEDLEIPVDVELVMPQDLYWNIPKIFHGGPASIISLGGTLRALLLILERQIELGIDSVISFCVSLNAFDREVSISVCGPISDLTTWLRENLDIPLLNHEEFITWLSKQTQLLSSTTSNRPPPFSLKDIHGDGVMYLKRTPIQEEIEVEYTNEEIGLRYQMTIPESLDWLLPAVEQNLITPVLNYTISKSICSKTQKSYLESPFSRWMDETTLSIQEGEPLGLFWTDRPK